MFLDIEGRPLSSQTVARALAATVAALSLAFATTEPGRAVQWNEKTTLEVRVIAPSGAPGLSLESYVGVYADVDRNALGLETVWERTQTSTEGLGADWSMADWSMTVDVPGVDSVVVLCSSFGYGHGTVRATSDSRVLTCRLRPLDTGLLGITVDGTPATTVEVRPAFLLGLPDEGRPRFSSAARDHLRRVYATSRSDDGDVVVRGGRNTMMGYLVRKAGFEDELHYFRFPSSARSTLELRPGGSLSIHGTLPGYLSAATEVRLRLPYSSPDAIAMGSLSRRVVPGLKIQADSAITWTGLPLKNLELEIREAETTWTKLARIPADVLREGVSLTVRELLQRYGTSTEASAEREGVFELEGERYMEDDVTNGATVWFLEPSLAWTHEKVSLVVADGSAKTTLRCNPGTSWVFVETDSQTGASFPTADCAGASSAREERLATLQLPLADPWALEVAKGWAAVSGCDGIVEERSKYPVTGPERTGDDSFLIVKVPARCAEVTLSLVGYEPVSIGPSRVGYQPGGLPPVRLKETSFVGGQVARAGEQVRVPGAMVFVSELPNAWQLLRELLVNEPELRRSPSAVADRAGLWSIGGLAPVPHVAIVTGPDAAPSVSGLFVPSQEEPVVGLDVGLGAGAKLHLDTSRLTESLPSDLLERSVLRIHGTLELPECGTMPVLELERSYDATGELVLAGLVEGSWTIRVDVLIGESIVSTGSTSTDVAGEEAYASLEVEGRVFAGRIQDSAGAPRGVRIQLFSETGSSSPADVDSDGRFITFASLEGAISARVTLARSSAGRMFPRETFVETVERGPSEDILLVVLPDRAIDGVVLVGSDGGPTLSAVVTAVHKDGVLARSTLRVVTEDDGRFRLENLEGGTWLLTASSSGHTSSAVEVTITGDSAIEHATLILSEGVKVAGRIVEADGSSQSDIRVEAVLLGDHEVGVPAVFTARSGQDGRFELSLPESLVGARVAVKGMDLRRSRMAVTTSSVPGHVTLEFQDSGSSLRVLGDGPGWHAGRVVLVHQSGAIVAAQDSGIAVLGRSFVQFRGLASGEWSVSLMDRASASGLSPPLDSVTLAPGDTASIRVVVD